MATFVVSGALANKYLNGGEAWVRLSWVLGLKKLGHEVFFVEQINRQNCVDSAGAVTSFDKCVNLAYFKKITEQFDLADSSALIYENGEQIHGASYGQLLEQASAAELLVNISGHLAFEPLLVRLRRKAYIDIDPGFTQFWHAVGNPGLRLNGYDYYFTIGENIGTSQDPIPTGNIHWRPIRQPVLLDHWPVVTTGFQNRFTTVASWRGPYGPVEFEGKTYGLKVHEFRKFWELPKVAKQTFEIALQIHPADARDLNSLRVNGWQIVDPAVAAPDPLAFRRYVQASGAEFSVAQGIYVDTQCGWFSDRTVRYLASGKPALIQDTGLSRHYPISDGLLTFRTLEEASQGAEEIARNYDEHCRAARALAETYFDSDKVLGRFVEEVGLS
jgi:hypothetical protein